MTSDERQFTMERVENVSSSLSFFSSSPTYTLDLYF